jgi:hypothetical protein
MGFILSLAVKQVKQTFALLTTAPPSSSSTEKKDEQLRICIIVLLLLVRFCEKRTKLLFVRFQVLRKQSLSMVTFKSRVH